MFDSVDLWVLCCCRYGINRIIHRHHDVGCNDTAGTLTKFTIVADIWRSQEGQCLRWAIWSSAGPVSGIVREITLGWLAFLLISQWAINTHQPLRAVLYCLRLSFSFRLVAPPPPLDKINKNSSLVCNQNNPEHRSRQTHVKKGEKNNNKNRSTSITLCRGLLRSSSCYNNSV